MNAPAWLPYALFGAMLVLMALRVPLWAAMFVPGALGYAYLLSDGALLAYLKGLAFARFSLYDLSVIPLFILMGQLATQGGLSRALFAAAAACVGHWRGGLAQASVLACAAFGAVCGSSVATAATIGQVALPEMRRFRYDGALATATLAAGGTLGILIPPSVVLVVYAIVAEQNIARLFAAALLPGLLAAAGYCVAIAVYCRRWPLSGPAEPRVPWSQRLRRLAAIWPVAAIFALVFGGIYGGVFTATEAAAVGVVLAGAAGWLRGELRRDGLVRALLATAETTAMIFVIFIGADMLNSALALTLMPQRLADWVAHWDVAPVLVIAAIVVFYLVLGGVMDELSMLLLTLPVLMPTVLALDLYGLSAEHKAIWFGVLLLCVVNVGLIAPPVGLNVAVISRLAPEVPMQRTYRTVFAFLVADAVRILLLLAFPALALWALRWVG